MLLQTVVKAGILHRILILLTARIHNLIPKLHLIILFQKQI